MLEDILRQHVTLHLAPVERLLAAVLHPAEPVPLPPLMEHGKAGPTPTLRRTT
jgi:hypothetical protein